MEGERSSFVASFGVELGLGCRVCSRVYVCECLVEDV